VCVILLLFGYTPIFYFPSFSQNGFFFLVFAFRYGGGLAEMEEVGFTFFTVLLNLTSPYLLPGFFI